MRIRYIDYTKGLAIILMIFGHTMTTINPIHIWIYSFHMPIFFMIDGILIGEKEKHKSIELTKKHIFQKVRILGIPYFVFGTILAIFYTLLNVMGNEPLSFFKKMWSLVTFRGIDSLWFIPIYFFCDLFVKILGRLSGYKGRAIIISGLAVFLIFMDLEYSITEFSSLIYKILLGSCFIEIGIIIAKFQVIKKNSCFLSYVIFISGFLLAQVNGSVEIAPNNIGNPILYLLSATLTSIAIMNLFENLKCEHNKDQKRTLIVKILDVLDVYGKNSIVLLCTNNLLIEIIRLLDYKIFGNSLISLGTTGSVLFTIILLVIEWFVIKLAKGPFSLFFGHLKKFV